MDSNQGYTFFFKKYSQRSVVASLILWQKRVIQILQADKPKNPATQNGPFASHTQREQVLEQSVRPGSDSSIKKTPPRSVMRFRKIQLPGDDGTKNSGPEPVEVSNAFDFPERYMSPTDRLISPVSKRVLARNGKVGAMLAPGKTPFPFFLIGDSRFQGVDLFQA